MEYDVEAPNSGETNFVLSAVCESDASLGVSPELSSQIPSEVAAILAELRRALLRNTEGARFAALQLVTLLAPPASAVEASSRGCLAPWQKRKVDHYIRENLDHALRINKLAAQVSLSTYHFSRIFKRTFGESPHAYIVRLRLQMAQELLLSTTDPLGQIAVACGFADQSHLTKVFRRGVGTTPNVWRRLNLTEAQARATKLIRSRTRPHAG